MTQGLTNLMRREAERVISRKAPPQMGIVSSYDPNQYAAKVILQPSGVETGFIPISSPWVGNGWGFGAGPNAGDVVDVHFQEWGKGAPYIEMRFYGNKARPMPVPSGECWMMHKLGTFVKFLNDGTLAIGSPVGINVTSPLTTITGNVIVNGQIQATEDITDYYTTTGSSMRNFRREYDEHVHRDTYSGNTTPPLAPDLL